VSVVPLRQGGGTRLKILESLAMGTPVVSTAKGAEGLDLVAERDLLIADAPDAFAAAVLRLLGDPALRERLGANGRREVVARYDWQVIGRTLCEFVDQLAAGKTSG
jgi:glycosyltransferase involved in cell wall biosynthesis